MAKMKKRILSQLLELGIFIWKLKWVKWKE